jgi:hypothetical protein
MTIIETNRDGLPLLWWVYVEGDRLGPFDDEQQAEDAASDVRGDYPEYADGVEVVREPDYRLGR